MRQARNDKSRQIGDAPEQTIPNRPVVERVVQIDQEWRVGLKFVRDRRDGGLSVRHVMKNPERKGEIERLRRQRYIGDAMADDSLRFSRSINSVSRRSALRRWDRAGADAGRAAQPAPTSARYRSRHPAPRRRRAAADARENTEIIVEYRLALLAREMVRTLAEC